jgi:hypothetical protein
LLVGLRHWIIHACACALERSLNPGTLLCHAAGAGSSRREHCRIGSITMETLMHAEDVFPRCRMLLAPGSGARKCRTRLDLHAPQELRA